jgi:hypothetical protein
LPAKYKGEVSTGAIKIIADKPNPINVTMQLTAPCACRQKWLEQV